MTPFENREYLLYNLMLDFKRIIEEGPIEYNLKGFVVVFTMEGPGSTWLTKMELSAAVGSLVRGLPEGTHTLADLMNPPVTDAKFLTVVPLGMFPAPWYPNVSPFRLMRADGTCDV